MDFVRERSRWHRIKERIVRYRWPLLVLIALICSVGFGLGSGSSGIPRSTLWIGTVTSGPMSIEATGVGVLRASEIRWLTASTQATVQRIVLRPGAEVEPGTLIMELSSPEAEEALLSINSAVTVAEAELAGERADLQAQLLQQKASLTAAEARSAEADINLQAQRRAHEYQVIPEVEYKRSVVVAEQLAKQARIEQEHMNGFRSRIAAQIAAKAAALDKVRNEARLRQQHVDALKVRASIRGVVQAISIEEGQQVSAGANLAKIARPDSLIAELRIAETQAKGIVIGMPARVDTRLGIVQGRVSRVDPAAQGGNVSVDVTFTGELPKGARPDLSIDGVVQVEDIPDTLFIPKPNGAPANGATTLFRLEGDSRALRVPVQLGRNSMKDVEVVSGLKAGDRVVLSDMSQYQQQDSLNIR